MSRLFGQLKDLQQKRSAQGVDSAAIFSVPSTKLSPIFFVLIIATAVVALFLGVLLSNLAADKSKDLAGVNKKIQQQQDQIVALNKEIASMQSSMNSRIEAVEATSKDLNQNTLDQSSANMNRIEAVLQSNIDELNSKLNNLQSSTPTPPTTGNQT